jgi:YVTN family beta-propeller protein
MRKFVLCLLFCLTLHAQDKAAFAIVEKVASRVSFYSSEGKRVAEVAVGNTPHEGVLSPDGRLLYVSDNGVLWMTDTEANGNNTISVIDVASRKRVKTIDLGEYRRPHGLTIDSQGRLWSTTEKPDGVAVIDPKAGKVLQWIDTKGLNPHMVEWHKPSRTAWVSNVDSSTLAVVDGKNVKLIEGLMRPQGGLFSQDGSRFYVTNGSTAGSDTKGAGGFIAVIDTKTLRLVQKIETGKGPGRIALTPDGKTLVYNLGADEAAGFADIATGKQIAVVPIGGRPLSCTISRDGKTAYFGIQDQDKVVMVSVPDRKVIRTIDLPKGSGPDPVIPLP